MNTWWMALLLAVMTILGGIAAIWFFWDKIAARFLGPSRNRLSGFVREGQVLRARSHDNPLPVAEVNAWVERMNVYFRGRKGRGYDVRLNDFTGLTFYSSGTARANFEIAIDGRLRRLHEFLKEI